MRLHCDVRVQVIERAICLLTTLPATLVHSLNLFISTTGTLVLLGTGNRNKGINLVVKKNWSVVRHENSAGETGRDVFRMLPAQTYLSWTASCSDVRRGIWDTGCGRLVWSLHVSRMPILVPPAVWSRLVHSWGWMALILCHLVGLWVVGRIGWRVSRALLLLLSD
jgi:hypothetical protein